MKHTLTQYLASIRDNSERGALFNFLKVIADSYSTQSLRDAAIVITGVGAGTSKLGTTDWYGFVNGVLVKIDASTDNAAYAGTVAADTFNVFCHYVDKDGTLTTQMGTAGASLAAVKFPERPEGKCLYGFTIINPTGTGDFVGGTTDLDDATVVPNAVYVSIVGTPDISIRI